MGALAIEAGSRRLMTRLEVAELGHPWQVTPYSGGQHLGGAGTGRITSHTAAPEQLAAALVAGAVPPTARIVLGAGWDAVPVEEARDGLTRACLEAAAGHRGGLWLWTRRAAVVELLATSAVPAGTVRVAIGLSTLKRELAARYEGLSDEPLERLRTIARLARAGWEVDLMVGPLEPGVTDGPEALDGLVTAAAAAGASGLVPPLRRLPVGSRGWTLPGVRALHPTDGGRPTRPGGPWPAGGYTAALADYLEERALVAGLVVPQPALHAVTAPGQLHFGV